LLFKRVTRSNYPVVTNLYGTMERVKFAFGGQARELISEIAELPALRPSLALLWEKRSLLLRLAKTGIARGSSSGLSEISSPKLDSLPVSTSWKEDGGPFFTLPLVYTEHPDSKVPNLGIYRLQRFDDETTGLHMQIGKGGGFHLARYKELGRAMPVNVFLGGPPIATLAAILPLPENVPEVIFASLLLGRKLKMETLSGCELPSLADSEFVLSGSCDSNELRAEGPFGDHYGYYSLTHDFPVFHCKKLFARKNAVYPATVVGKPRQEDYYIGNYLQEVLSPIFPLAMPAVVDLWSYGETGFHSLAAAVVRERYKGEALASAFRILGEGQLSLTKFLLLTDKKITLQNFRLTLEHILERCDFRTGLRVFANTSMDTLDYTGGKLNEGSKGVMIGVGEKIRELPGEAPRTLPFFLKDGRIFCRGCLVIQGESYEKDKDLPARTAREDFGGFPLVVLVDDVSSTIKDDSAFLWTVFTRFEPARDLHASSVALRGMHPELKGPIVIDARMKPWYPAELDCDQTTKVLVDRKWDSYNIPS
jgi:4-hydroxybenzoate decarboxylase subunit C